MVNKKVLILPVVQGVALVFAAMLPQTSLAEEASRWSWSNAQLGAVYVTQGGGDNTSAIGKYRPGYNFDLGDHKLVASLDLGISGFQNADSQSFAVFQYGALGTYSVTSQWDLGLSAGVQTWTSGNGTAFYAGPEVTYHLSQKPFSFFDGIFVAYNAVFQSKFASLVEAGLNFKF